MLRSVVALAAVVALAPAAALAHGAPMSGAPMYGPNDDAILPAPPANAPPGVCYAHVRVPGQPAMTPPPMGGPGGPGGARWEQHPPPPGAIGPVWCLVGGTPHIHGPGMPAHEGWVRVECDTGRPPPPPPCGPCETRREVELRDGWLSWPGKTYF